MHETPVSGRFYIQKSHTTTYFGFVKLYQTKRTINTAYNSGLAQAGFYAKFKVGFVFGGLVINLYIWLTKFPPDAKPPDVGRQLFSKFVGIEINMTKILSFQVDRF